MNRFAQFGRLSPFVLIFAAWICPSALAQTDLSKFPLSKALPADCFIAVAARGNPERKFLDQYWRQVHDALAESGILTDIWDMVIENVEDDKLEMIENVHTRFSTLCTEVEWDHLFSKDFIFAGRFISPFPQAFTFEGVMLGRLNKESAQKNYVRLKAILEEIVKLVKAHGGEDFLNLNETKKEGYVVTSLCLSIAPGLGLSVAACEDVIAIGFGTTAMLDESLNLLQGKGETKSIIQTDRFKNAFAKLPPAEDTIVFFDTANMMNKLGNFFKKIEGVPRKQKPAQKRDSDRREAAADDSDSDKDDEPESSSESTDEEEFNPLPMINRIIGDLTFVDYVAEVEWTDGHRVFTDSLTALLPNAEENAMTGVFTDVTPVKDFAKFIPNDATTFSSTSGISLPKFYSYIRQIMKDEVPGGKETLRDFDVMQKEEWNIDIAKDVLEVYNGPMTSVQLPGGDWVLLMGVTDGDKARDQLKRLIAFINEQIGENNQLSLSPVDVGAKAKFTQVTHPMMMMMGGFAPVYGIAEDHLVFGSSAKAVGKIIKTASGDAPNITKSKQWQEEGLAPKDGKIDSISFTDERKFGEELQQGLAGLSMGLGMATMMIQSQDIPPPVQNLLKAVPPMLAKLGPVAGKLNFYQSSASYTTFDGKRWHTRSVQNYKDPAEVKKELEQAGDDGSASGPTNGSKKKSADEDDSADEKDE